MKNVLFGTTALVGVLAFAGGALADAPKITVGGFVDFQAGYSDEDAVTSTSDDLNFQNDTELHISVDGKSDNGLGYGAVIELEADVDNDADGEGVNADKTFLYVEGGWGRFEMGSNVGSTNTMKVDAGTLARATGGISGDFYDFVTIPSANYIIRPDSISDHGTLATTAGVTRLTDSREDATKITYYSPRFSGFQLGVSYTPDTGEVGQAPFTGSTNAGDAENAVGLGLNYSAQYEGFTVAASATGEFGEAEDTATARRDELNSYAFGLNVGFSGFTLGGSWGTWEDSLALSTANMDSEYWTLGGAYDFGPFGASITYMQSETEMGVRSYEFDNLSVGADYMLAPGLVPYAEVSFFQFDEPVGVTRDNDGTVFLLGTELTF